MKAASPTRVLVVLLILLGTCGLASAESRLYDRLLRWLHLRPPTATPTSHDIDLVGDIYRNAADEARLRVQELRREMGSRWDDTRRQIADIWQEAARKAESTMRELHRTAMELRRRTGDAPGVAEQALEDVARQVAAIYEDAAAKARERAASLDSTLHSSWDEYRERLSEVWDRAHREAERQMQALSYGPSSAFESFAPSFEEAAQPKHHWYDFMRRGGSSAAAPEHRSTGWFGRQREREPYGDRYDYVGRGLRERIAGGAREAGEYLSRGAGRAWEGTKETMGDASDRIAEIYRAAADAAARQLEELKYKAGMRPEEHRSRLRDAYENIYRNAEEQAERLLGELKGGMGFGREGSYGRYHVPRRLADVHDEDLNILERLRGHLALSVQNAGAALLSPLEWLREREGQGEGLGERLLGSMGMGREKGEKAWGESLFGYERPEKEGWRQRWFGKEEQHPSMYESLSQRLGQAEHTIAETARGAGQYISRGAQAVGEKMKEGVSRGGELMHEMRESLPSMESVSDVYYRAMRAAKEAADAIKDAKSFDQLKRAVLNAYDESIAAAERKLAELCSKPQSEQSYAERAEVLLAKKYREAALKAREQVQQMAERPDESLEEARLRMTGVYDSLLGAVEGKGPSLLSRAMDTIKSTLHIGGGGVRAGEDTGGGAKKGFPVSEFGEKVRQRLEHARNHALSLMSRPGESYQERVERILRLYRAVSEKIEHEHEDLQRKVQRLRSRGELNKLSPHEEETYRFALLYLSALRQAEKEAKALTPVPESFDEVKERVHSIFLNAVQQVEGLSSVGKEDLNALEAARGRIALALHNTLAHMGISSKLV